MIVTVGVVVDVQDSGGSVVCASGGVISGGVGTMGGSPTGAQNHPNG